MNCTLLIVYEPALFLLAALGWAAWELWSVRTRKDKPKTPSAHPGESRDPSAAGADEPDGPA